MSRDGVRFREGDPPSVEKAAGRSERGRVLEVVRLGRVSYDEGLALQGELISLRRAGEIADRLLLLEHPHVITLGTGTDPDHLLIDAEERERLGIELREAGRGGDVTYHGPGQLVGYPILDLNPDRRDLHRYLRDLEEVLIRTLATFDVEARRLDGLTGVWVDGAKVAAIGVRVSSGWITSHGFALNVIPDLDYFGAIVPCGIGDRPVTSLGRILEREVTLDDVVPPLVAAFSRVFERDARPTSRTTVDPTPRTTVDPTSRATVE